MPWLQPWMLSKWQPPTMKEEEIVRLRDENRKLRAALDAVTDEAEKKERYYYNLVWLARRSKEKQRRWAPHFYDTVKPELGGDEALFRQFMQDKQDLSDPNAGSFHHGFNSGCLGSARLFLGLSTWEDHKLCEHVDGDNDCDEECFEWTKDERKYALNTFPDLDT